VAREYKSPIVDLLANAQRPMTTIDIATALGQAMENMGPRLRDLEAKGKVSRVGTAKRLRDVRWKVAEPGVKKRGPISYRAVENIDAMRAAARDRMLSGKPASWMQETDTHEQDLVK
jgi:hypothetical protein